MKHVEPERLADAAMARGWVHVRTNGSHFIYRNGRETLVIPFHRGTMAPGTQRAIMRKLGITDDDL